MSIKSILRTVIASGFVVGAFAALSPAAFAADNISGGDVTGNITAIQHTAYTAATTATTIVPNTDQSNLDFGSVNVQSNANNGWTLAVASANGSSLKNGSIGTIAYALQVDGVPVTGLTTPAASVTAKDVSGLTASATGGANYAVTGAIAATASNGQPAGTYTDTLTFTLTNK